jgi:hypothetical protein
MQYSYVTDKYTQARRQVAPDSLVLRSGNFGGAIAWSYGHRA